MSFQSIKEIVLAERQRQLASLPGEIAALDAALAGPYFFAKGLKGFKSDVLRVKVSERRDGMVWCRTADLLDAGTPLVLDECHVKEVAR